MQCGNFAMYSIEMYQCNKVYSHFECYEMDVLKCKIGCGIKTKLKFRLNKTLLFHQVYIALRVKE